MLFLISTYSHNFSNILNTINFFSMVKQHKLAVIHVNWQCVLVLIILKFVGNFNVNWYWKCLLLLVMFVVIGSLNVFGIDNVFWLVILMLWILVILTFFGTGNFDVFWYWKFSCFLVFFLVYIILMFFGIGNFDVCGYW